MSYTTIMVHLQLGQPHIALLQLATSIANRFDARLVGIAASQPMEAVFAEGYVSGDLIDADLRELQHEMAQAKSAFHTAAALCAAPGEWRQSSDCLSIATYVAQAARDADLIIVARPRSAPVDTQRQLQLPDLLMRAGRPVLIARSQAGPLPLTHALVAWDDSRECRRAIVDAMPLLLRAGRVSVAQVIRAQERTTAEAQLESVLSWLRRHGIDARALLETESSGADSQLPTIARDQECDLIVAGAYGHSRLREWALGGVTRALIGQEHMATLLSH